MSQSLLARHALWVDLPVGQCQMLFTPAGEVLWVDGWQPRYLTPIDGRTQVGMSFLTGDGDDTTVWFMTEFSQHPHRAAYLRVTPASRWAQVTIECVAEHAQRTRVEVSYHLHAITDQAAPHFAAFAPESFARMIGDWEVAISARLDRLKDAVIP